MWDLDILLQRMAESVVVIDRPSMTLDCLNHLSDWLSVSWVPEPLLSPWRLNALNCSCSGLACLWSRGVWSLLRSVALNLPGWWRGLRVLRCEAAWAGPLFRSWHPGVTGLTVRPRLVFGILILGLSSGDDRDLGDGEGEGVGEGDGESSRYRFLVRLT